MKRLAYSVVFLVGFIGLMEWLTQGFAVSWEPRLRQYLETTLGLITHCPTHIDSIEIASFHKVRVINIRLDDPTQPAQPVFQASRIELELGPLVALRALYHRRPYEAVGHIFVQNPWVRLHPRILKRRDAPSQSTTALPLWFTLTWEGGFFQWVDESPTHHAQTLYQTEGSVRIRGPLTRLTVNGKSQDGQACQIVVNLQTGKQKTVITHMEVKTPPLDLFGEGEVSRDPKDPAIAYKWSAKLTKGRIGRWPFQEASLQGRTVDGRWEFLDNSIQLLKGRLAVKGVIENSVSDLSLTAENISVGELLHDPLWKLKQGTLSASATLKGPSTDWQLSGAWWMTDVLWGKAPLGNAKGDFEMTPHHFQAHAKSESTSFRLVLAGTRSEKVLELNQMSIFLPSGASFSVEARHLRKDDALQGSLTASHVVVPTDLPFLSLKESYVSGKVSAQGRFSGTLANPILHLAMKSNDLLLNGQSVGSSSATLVFENHRIDLPAFNLGTGIEGRLVGGQGKLILQNALIGKTTITDGIALFILGPGRLDIESITCTTKDSLLSGKSRWSWSTDPSSPKQRLSMEGSGNFRSVRKGDVWDIPFEFSGRMDMSPDQQEGAITVGAKVLDGSLRGVFTLSGTAEKPEATFKGELENARWRTIPFSTDISGNWSREGLKPLQVTGKIKTGGRFTFEGQLSPDAQANGLFTLTDFNLRSLGESLHFPKTIDGTMKASFTIQGPLNKLKWAGRMETGPMTYAATTDRPFKLEQMMLEMTLAPVNPDASIMRLTMTDGNARSAEELIRFRPGSFVEFAGKNPARLGVGADVRNLHLGFFTLFGGLDLDGLWQIKPEGFAIQTKVYTRSLFINDYELEEGLLLADYFNGAVKFSAPSQGPALVTGSVDFQKAPNLKFTDLFIAGKDAQGVGLTGDIGPAHWDFKMKGKALDIGTLAELAGFPYPFGGIANIQVQGTGDAKHPHVRGDIELERGTIMGLAFRSGSAAFVWQDEKITFSKWVLSDPGHYTLEGAGMFPLISKQKPDSGSRPLDFSFRLIDSNLSLLKSFSREVQEAKGNIEGLVHITGTLEDPNIRGSLKVSDGYVLGAHYFRELRGGGLWLEFSGDTVTIKDLHGKSGKGEFRASGTVTLAGFVPSKYDLKLDVTSSNGVDVLVPELAIPDSPLAKKFNFLTTASRVEVRGNVALRGSAESPTFSGDAIFSKGHFTFPPSRKKPGNPAVMEWFRRIYWDVQLRFMDGAWFENELVQANVVGGFKLKGPSSKLAVDGGIDIEEGKISYLGLQFDIQQAHYDIRSETTGDRVVNTPYVRGAAESQIQAVDTVSGVAGGGGRMNVNDTITLNIDYAPIDQIKPRLTSASNPTMGQDKLLARVTQTDSENLTPQERTYLYQKQLVALIDTSLTTPLAQNVLKKTGIADRLRVQHVFDPNAVTGDDLNTTNTPAQQSAAVSLLSNTKYTIEKDLSTRLSLGYGVRFVPSTKIDPDIQEKKLDLVSDVQLSYRWFKNVYLKGDFELPTANPSILPDRRVTIEPRWRFGWWGNTNKDKQKK